MSKVNKFILIAVIIEVMMYLCVSFIAGYFIEINVFNWG